jgi:hypothetical protein
VTKPTILIELFDSSANLSGRRTKGRLDDRVPELMDALGVISDQLEHVLASRPVGPPSEWGLGEVEVMIGLECTTEAGVVLAKAGATATIQATLIWRRRSDD